MRKVTRLAVQAFRNRENFKLGNTEVRDNGDTSALFLHGNAIAQIHDGSVYISNGGWFSVTTKERLNGLLSAMGAGGIHQKDFVWYLNDEEWDGSWVRVNV